MSEDDVRQYRIQNVDKRIAELNTRLAKLEEQKSRLIHNAPSVSESLASLGLSRRTYGVLVGCGFETVFDVIDFLDHGTDALQAIQGVGKRAANEIIASIEAKGYDVPDA